MRLLLPSGMVALLDQEPGAEPARNPADLRQAYERLAQARFINRAGEVVDFRDLQLRDAHIVMAVLDARSVDPAQVTAVHCDNCGADLSVPRGSGFEFAVYRDGEATDPELDMAFDFARSYSLGRGGRRAARVELRPRCVGDVLPLTDQPPPWPVSPNLVARLGIAVFAGERAASRIVRALESASEESWGQLGRLWEEAHYGARLFASSACECGARVERPVPTPRLFEAIAASLPAAPKPAAVDFETFAAWCEEARDEVFAEFGLRSLPVLADEGVPACDDGGNPLLGSYLPPAGEDLPGEIRLYYRSFIEESRIDKHFDIRSEVFETVSHEATHHLHFLRGDDPLDDEERLALAQELERVVGRSELRRRGLRALVAEGRGALVGLFPMLVLLTILFVLLYCQD